MNRKSPLVNYDTQWTNPDFTNQTFCFKAGTPVQEILSTLETGIDSNFKENYQTASVRFSFNRLYRNLIDHYKGWQVHYRKPGSKKNYGKIKEKIGYQSRTKKRSLQRTILKKPMRWTHDLYPLIDRVEIKGVDSCQTIAQRLNSEIIKPNFKRAFESMESDFSDLCQSYHRLKNEPFNDNYKEEAQTFCTRFKNISGYYEQVNLFLNKKYTLQAFNINDILQVTDKIKSAKGWRVEILSSESASPKNLDV